MALENGFDQNKKLINFRLDRHDAAIAELNGAVGRLDKKLVTKTDEINKSIQDLIIAVKSGNGGNTNMTKATLLGAGGGGFLYVIAPPEKHDAIREALGRPRELTFEFDRRGSRIIFISDHRDL